MKFLSGSEGFRFLPGISKLGQPPQERDEQALWVYDAGKVRLTRLL